MMRAKSFGYSSARVDAETEGRAASACRARDVHVLLGDGHPGVVQQELLLPAELLLVQLSGLHRGQRRVGAGCGRRIERLFAEDLHRQSLSRAASGPSSGSKSWSGVLMSSAYRRSRAVTLPWAERSLSSRNCAR